MSSLTDFLKEHAAKYRAEAPERERRRDEWVQAVGRLMDQLEGWLRAADPEKLLQVERLEVEKREWHTGAYTAPALRVTLGPHRVEVLPAARDVLGPMSDEALVRGRARGRVDLTDGARTFHLYRYLEESGERWVLVDDEEYVPTGLTRETFEAALVALLR